MGSKYTPGPWIVSGCGIWVETSPGVGGPNPQPPEGEQIGDFTIEADAVLAGAAPEMLEAMQDVALQLDGTAALREGTGPLARAAEVRDEDLRYWAAILYAAIAKATGEEVA